MSLKSMLAAMSNDRYILTPGVITWLDQHAEEAWPEHVADRIRDELMKTPRVRSGSFSSSASGTCMRRQELAYLGVHTDKKHPYDLQNLFNDGKWRHLRWQAMLLTAGLIEDIEVSLPWQRMRSMGSMDGRGSVPTSHPRRAWRGLEFGFELKGVTPFQYPKLAKDPEPKGEHMKQIHRYFLSGGYDLFVVVYEDKATQQFTEWVVEPDPVLLEESRQELEDLNNAVDTKTLHPLLPSCKIYRGRQYNDCPFTGKSGPCHSITSWEEAEDA